MSIKVGITLISVLLLCTAAAAAQGRKLLHTTNEFSAYSPITNDGICKTLVEKQGYKCEEHTVDKYYSYSMLHYKQIHKMIINDLGNNK